MKHIAGKVATIAVLALLLVSAMHAADKSKDSPSSSTLVSVWQTRRAFAASLCASYSYSYIEVVDRNSFRFDNDSFEFEATLRNKKREHFKVDLKNLVPVFPKRGALGHYRVKDEAGRDLPAPLNRLLFGEKDAAPFAAAINRLREFARNSGETTRAFTQQAEAWRALPAKPPIPEAVRSQRLLAENAVREKKLDEALSHYETGLDLYPTWPQGYFNAALIAAELGYFAEAVELMQAYLQFVPDAPDAQSARDQIVIWQYKAK